MFCRKIFSTPKIIVQRLALTKKYQRQKITGHKISSLTSKIPITSTRFWLLLPNSGDGGWNLATLAGF
jgi:hypothetical protein